MDKAYENALEAKKYGVSRSEEEEGRMDPAPAISLVIATLAIIATRISRADSARNQGVWGRKPRSIFRTTGQAGVQMKAMSTTRFGFAPAQL